MVFGRKKKTKNTINDSLDNLDKHLRLLEYKIKKQHNEAKQHLKNGNKSKALKCMKIKKMHESQKDKIISQKFNIEKMQMAVDNAKFARDTMSALNMGGKALKKLYKNVNPEEIEEQMDKIEETLEDTRSIADVMGRSLDGGIEENEEDLLAELNDEIEQDVSLDLNKISLPNNTDAIIPSHNVEEDELAALMKEMQV